MTQTLLDTETFTQTVNKLKEIEAGYIQATREHHFAVADAFNEVLPLSIGGRSRSIDTNGLSATEYQRMVGACIDDLLDASGLEVDRRTLSGWRTTARAWSPDERRFDVSFCVYTALNAHKEIMRDGLTMAAAVALVRSNDNGTDAHQALLAMGAARARRVRDRAYNGELLNRAVNAIGGGLDCIRTIVEDGVELNDKGRENLARALGYGQELAIILEEYALEPELAIAA